MNDAPDDLFVDKIRELAKQYNTTVVYFGENIGVGVAGRNDITRMSFLKDYVQIVHKARYDSLQRAFSDTTVPEIDDSIKAYTG